MVLSCASAAVGGRASPMPSAAAARNMRVRLRILAVLEAAAAAARCRAALRHVVRPQVSQEATNPEAPFRGSGALTARHGPHLNPSSIAGGGKDVRTLAPRSGEAGEGQSSHHRSLAASPSPVPPCARDTLSPP